MCSAHDALVFADFRVPFFMESGNGLLAFIHGPAALLDVSGRQWLVEDHPKLFHEPVGGAGGLGVEALHLSNALSRLGSPLRHDFLWAFQSVDRVLHLP